ncbi:hypothetical protein ACFPK1_27510 [Actinomycetospora rhizophila]|uniref:Uncharacterized protein n=1 Tax=Actinomycetospora rhizophila TaxID=1416876 RepID=A0ABV9ZNG4_9PSEU
MTAVPSVTSWTRIEPIPQDPSMPGFAARVADPLWLLARQWQLAELTARDRGSPVRVDLTVESAPLERHHPGPPDASGAPLDRAVPLEATVEAEPRAAPGVRGSARDAAVTGSRLLALLGQLADELREALVATYAIPAPPTDADPAAARRVDLLRRSVPDGRALADAIAAAQAAGDVTTALPGLDRTDPAAVTLAGEAATAWLGWYVARPVLGGAPPAGWRAERLVHEVSIAAPGTSETVLVGRDHDGGELDWWSFDVAPGASLGVTGPAPAARTSTTLPTGLALAGLPASRFWVMESGDVNLDRISAAPEELGRLLFTEFAVAYGNDFFVVPVTVDVASVTRVRGLTVRTTFDEDIAVPSSVAADVAAGRPPLRLFVSSEDGHRERAEEVLLVAPSAVGAIDGAALEDVLLARDETANLAWAVERRVPGVDGRGAERVEELRRGAPPAAPALGSPQPPVVRYELASEVPANWRAMTSSARDAQGDDRPVLRLIGGTGRGELLFAGWELHAERLSRTGMCLRRRARRARSSDGRTITWTRRETAPATGESTSGLRFDQLSDQGIP